MSNPIADPRIKEKMELDIDVNKLKMLEASFKNQHYTLQDRLRKTLPASISATEHKIELLERDKATADKTKSADFQMTILGKTFGLDAEGNPRKQEAGEALLAAAQTLGRNDGTVGEYRGFRMSFYMEQATGKVYLNLQGATTHNVELGTSVLGNLSRIENAINGIPQRFRSDTRAISELSKSSEGGGGRITAAVPSCRRAKREISEISEIECGATEYVPAVAVELAVTRTSQRFGLLE